MEVGPGALGFATQSARGRSLRARLEAFSEVAAGVGYCSHPVKLSGSSMTVDTTTGEVVSEYSLRRRPDGRAVPPVRQPA